MGHFLFREHSFYGEKLLIAQVERVLRPYLTPHSKLVVGVSGGPDSLALLHMLKQLVAVDNLVAAHLHHGLRAEADEEMQFVLQTAASWGIDCVVDRVSVAELAKEQGWSIEEAGRQARYRFLAEVAEAEAADLVLVAHHADDQVERVLMNIIRGSGLAGLRGMQMASPLPGRPELTLLRPLLELTRAEIEAYCEANRLRPIYDQSNEERHFFRNRIRGELLPLLTQYNPQIKSHLRQLAAITAADYAAMEAWFQVFWQSVFVDQGEGWLSLTRSRWLELPLSHKRLALRKAVQTLRPWQTDIGFRSIELARELLERNVTGLQMNLPGDLRLQVGYQNILIFRDEASLPAPFVPQLEDETSLVLPVPGEVPLGHGWVLEAEIFAGNREEIERNENPWLAYFDLGEAERLQVRTRQPGERFQPLGMNGHTAKVKEVMINRKVARGLRPYWPIVSVEKHLIWLVGYHQDERTRVSPSTSRIVQISCRQEEGE